jgi:uncharacterized tellurite resistance protein B-like protein|tara:strand:- start:95 stop:436 length:342 start_codon:yes stop_codon:yes gene_type:complete
MGILTRLILGKDDYLFDKLNDKEKLAFCRLVNEVVKADGIVISKELDELPEIPKAFLGNSKKLSLDEAIDTLKNLSDDHKTFIYEELNEVMESDEYSSDEEKKVVQNIISRLK